MKHTNEEKFKSDIQLEVARRIKESIDVDFWIGDRKVHVEFEYISDDGRKIKCSKSTGIQSVFRNALHGWDDASMRAFIADLRNSLRKAEADYEKYRAKG